MQEIHKIEPASEEWWLFRKPISESTITDNVLHWGTGGLNIDGCRVACIDKTPFPKSGYSRHASDSTYQFAGDPKFTTQGDDTNPFGRWPANVVHDGSDEVVGMFPDVKAVGRYKEPLQDCKTAYPDGSCNATSYDIKNTAGVRRRSHMYSGQDGSAARFFYSTKSNARHSKISQGKPMYTLHHGDCLEVLQTLPDNSVDSIVTDPPAGIAFMNMQWDKDKGGRDVWIAWMEKVAKECLRVMKPGGHALVWSLPRTSHWTGTAWENAGWEPRDKIYFLFGTGFPKSMNIGKQIDKMRGATRTVVGYQQAIGNAKGKGAAGHYANALSGVVGYDAVKDGWDITAPATEEAKQWDGWGTGLKPASEEWWLFRKPISESTITDNVLHWGTGGLNIDGCRVEGAPPSVPQPVFKSPTGSIYNMKTGEGRNGEMSQASGRWPANVVHDGSDEVVGMFPDVKAGTAVRENSGGNTFGGNNKKPPMNNIGYNDSGSAARFFYGAKASVRDRDEGLSKSDTTTRANIHPTVKSTELMRYLCRLITPPHGIVLDPFAGSGSTGKGALKEGFQFIGIEMDEEYVTIARARLEHVLQQKGSS